MERIPYVIVGGGLAGTAAIDAIRRRDKSGHIVLVGDERHLPYDRVPLSKGYLLGTTERADLDLRPARFYERHKVELCLGQAATALDAPNRQLTLADGRTLAFDNLLLATGGQARRLRLPGHELQGIFALRTLEDAVAIQQAMATAQCAVVVGGGFIGCEVAAGLAQRGIHTTIVEVTAAPLSLVLDAETSAFMATYLQQRGITLLTDTAASAFVGDNGQVRAVATNRGTELPADLVIVGVGLVLNVALAEQAGLPMDNGVVVNEFLEAAPGIYAAGDIARYYSPLLNKHLRVEHYDVALQHGRTAGANMTGTRQAYNELPYFFSHMPDLHIDVIGDMSRREHSVRRGPLQADPGFTQFYFAEGLLQAVLCINGDPTLMQAARERLLERRPVNDLAAFADPQRALASL